MLQCSSEGGLTDDSRRAGVQHDRHGSRIAARDQNELYSGSLQSRDMHLPACVCSVVLAHAAALGCRDA